MNVLVKVWRAGSPQRDGETGTLYHILRQLLHVEVNIRGMQAPLGEDRLLNERVVDRIFLSLVHCPERDGTSRSSRDDRRREEKEIKCIWVFTGDLS